MLKWLRDQQKELFPNRIRKSSIILFWALPFCLFTYWINFVFLRYVRRTSGLDKNIKAKRTGLSKGKLHYFHYKSATAISKLVEWRYDLLKYASHTPDLVLSLFSNKIGAFQEKSQQLWLFILRIFRNIITRIA